MKTETSIFTHVAKIVGAGIVAAISAFIAMYAEGKALGILASGAAFVMILLAVSEFLIAIRLARSGSVE